jgi:hypothetical protein
VTRRAVPPWALLAVLAASAPAPLSAQPAPNVRGTVVDADGTPVAGAAVRLSASYSVVVRTTPTPSPSV